MTQKDILADLEEASRIAKSGEDMPLLGSSIGLMWGILITVVLLYQYLILSGRIGLPEMTLFFAWIGFGIIGGIGSTILGRAADRKPGTNSVNNRVESYVWIMFAGSMGALTVGVFLNMLFGGGNQTVWNTVLIFVFAGQGIAYGVVAKLTKLRLLHITSFASFTFSSLAFLFVDKLEVYLLAAIGAVVTIIIPNLILKLRSN